MFDNSWHESPGVGEWCRLSPWRRVTHRFTPFDRVPGTEEEIQMHAVILVKVRTAFHCALLSRTTVFIRFVFLNSGLIQLTRESERERQTDRETDRGK